MKDLPALEKRIRSLVWTFILGLVISGATAMPLETELRWFASLLGIHEPAALPAQPGFRDWIAWVWKGLAETNAHYPFIGYGFDWLAFGHFIIAIAFIGALRDPVRNIWLFEFGMIACVLVIPFALVAGEVRGIPIYWRLIDCSFGVLGFPLVWMAHRDARKLESLSKAHS